VTARWWQESVNVGAKAAVGSGRSESCEGGVMGALEGMTDEGVGGEGVAGDDAEGDRADE
jgi:hypothetical protein